MHYYNVCVTIIGDRICTFDFGCYVVTEYGSTVYIGMALVWPAL